jgi:hypothetical protein
MRRIYYAGDRFLTGTAIAEALVAYAAALARHDAAEAVEVPIRHEENGRPGVVSFLVGPASQIVTEEVQAHGYDEIRDDALVEHLRARTKALAPIHPIATTSARDQDDPVGYDWTDEV